MDNCCPSAARNRYRREGEAICPKEGREVFQHARIIAHDVFLEAGNVGLLDDLDFVFICMDVGSAKHAVVERMVGNGTPFIDVGMGVLFDNGQLSGVVRTTISTASTRDSAAPHISFVEANLGANEYSSNIQIAELNALNAAIAVMRWKKFFGVYRDARNEVYAGYSIASDEIVLESAI